ncbi:hypothetical protein DA69_08010 [Brevundimonas naejangsanensis]|jgi:hypothetical protein|uniref:Uncharacterized protein n=1 Tax=Brevundimonas naejangsanensis TaxID=588932 RepID=A0A172Y636_9CAUL|nr:hypothetical protein [Brevundimonas naejangsanensis]ANF54687.1 hypothetical protein DA69_08010 [Brevundimonas naejangsanensis]
MTANDQDPRSPADKDSLQAQARRETGDAERRDRHPDPSVTTPQPDGNPDQRRKLEEEAAKAPAPTVPIANPD